MAAAEQAKQFALDSNVLFDLAEGREFAHTFREICGERGYVLRIPPTVVQELSYLAFKKHSSKSSIAIEALQKMRQWRVTPFDLQPVGHAVTEQFSNRLIEATLLPDGEFNDGLILAETALAGIPVLVSSDEHLLGIDATELSLQFKEADLSPVHVAHPKRLLAAMRPR